MDTTNDQPAFRRLARRVVGTTLRRLRQYSARLRRMSTATRSGQRFPIDARMPGDARTTVVLVSGEPSTPGHRYRVERHARAASDSGFRATVLDLDQISGAPDILDDRVAFVVLWRVPWDTRVRRVIEKARRRGATVIFDVDDLMTVPQFATVEFIDGIRTQDMVPAEAAGLFARIRQTARFCDACCCTTESLAGWLRMDGLMTFIVPNGFSERTLVTSRALVAGRPAATANEPVRIGYAAGSFTHQEDLRVAAPAVARVLRQHPHCRLVLFERCTDVSEFPEFAGLDQQIEWRRLVPLEQLPAELVRFDINLAPLQVNSPFCDAKSPLKYFEAALVDVPTIASPTGPFREAIIHGSTGLLADSESEWHDALTGLVNDAGLRRRMALNAYVDVLSRYGPQRRAQLVGQMYRQLGPDPRRAAEAFQLAQRGIISPSRVTCTVDYDRVFEDTRDAPGEVTIVVPVHNYAGYLLQALDSVAGQTLAAIDLVIVDDASTDDSLAVATSWARQHRTRFQRVAVLRFTENAGIAAARNLGFLVSRTPYVLPLDADNLLLPDCCDKLLAAIHRTGASFAYPRIREFGDSQGQGGRSLLPYHPQRLAGSNYIDAMALVSLEAWATAGGYAAGLLGWEDYDLWCALAERGMFGVHVETELALYRVHGGSMSRPTTDAEANASSVREVMRQHHQWVHPHPLLPASDPPARTAANRVIRDMKRALSRPAARPNHGVSNFDASPEGRRLRLREELLRCPIDLGGLVPEGDTLTCCVCGHAWPIVDGRPVLFDGLGRPCRFPDRHQSNPIPQRGEEMIEAATGWVLNLSAGGTRVQREHVIEVEASIFRHTDVVADAHRLPFEDGTFGAVIALNCFEHFHSPTLVAAEISRVLRPGGSVLVHTAFLQPLHEEPAHFYNTTSFGLRRWFTGFEIERVAVTDNFNPIYALAWTAADILECLKRDASEQSAVAFGTTTISEAAAYWLDPATRSHPRWAPLADLSEASRERTAAGFELIAHRPR